MRASSLLLITCGLSIANASPSLEKIINSIDESIHQRNPNLKYQLINTYSTYTVAKGDHLNKIAAKHGTTVDELLKINKIKNANLLRIGQTLKVPVRAKKVEPPKPEKVEPTQEKPKEMKAAQPEGPNRAIVIDEEEEARLAAERPQYHNVVSGDNLYKISKKHQISIDDIKAANPKLNPNRIYVGQKILLPKLGEKITTKSEPTPKKIAPKKEEPKKVDLTPKAPKEKEPEVKTESPYTRVIISQATTIADFAKHYKMTVKQVNDANGWNYAPDTLFEVGSEAWVRRP